LIGERGTPRRHAPLADQLAPVASRVTPSSFLFNKEAAMWKFEVYADTGGHYRWRLKASNGQTVASSGESFASKSNAKEAAENVKEHAGGASVEVEE
jgi:uncharacterized protein YegP (UPF0339 family)